MTRPHDPNVTTDIPSVPADSLDAKITGAHTPESEDAKAAAPVPTGAYVPRSDDDDPGESPRARPTELRSDTAIGTVIAGRYTLVEVIGEGGMGSVYLAEQSEPVKRQVALKLIKSRMDSRTVLNRFEAERQALALMDHPNIARIYDGGMTGLSEPVASARANDSTLACAF